MPATATATAASAGNPLRRLYGPWLVIFVLSCALYLFTAQRGMGWSDNGFYQWRILRGEFIGSAAVATAHPSIIGLGRLAWEIPIGNPWWRINAFGAPALALLVANVALLIRLFTGRWTAAIVIATLLGTSHLPWFEATSTKSVHVFSAAFLSTELLLLRGLTLRPDWRWLTALGFVAGLHWGFHNFALLALPVYGVVALRLMMDRRLPVWAPAPALALFALGAAPILLLTVREAMTCGSWTLAVRDMLCGPFEGSVLGQTGRAVWFKWNIALFALNFWNPFWLAVLPGIWALWRDPHRMLARALLCILLIHAGFFARYTVVDQASFALPTLTMLAIAAGVGMSVLMRQSAMRSRLFVSGAIALACLSPCVYLALNDAAHRFKVFPVRSRTLPFRDEARTWIVPWKQDDHSADAFAAAAMAQLEPDAVVLADWSAGYPLLLQQRLSGSKPQVAILTHETSASNDAVFAAAANRPRYVVSPAPGYVPQAMLDGTWSFTPTGVLYRVSRVPSSAPVPGRPEGTTPPGGSAPRPGPAGA